MADPVVATVGERTGWAAWVVFAAVVLLMNGVTNAVHGLAAIFRDEAFFADGEVVIFDLTTWGWIHLIVCVVLVVVGWKLWDGSPGARLAAVGLVSLDMLAQFAVIGAYPWWGIISIALDVVVLYAVIVHGGELGPARSGPPEND